MARGALAHPRAQGLGLQVFQDHSGVSLMLASVVDDNDSVVAATGGDARLGNQSLGEMRALRVPQLDGHQSSEPGGARAVCGPRPCRRRRAGGSRGPATGDHRGTVAPRYTSLSWRVTACRRHPGRPPGTGSGSGRES